MSSIRDIKLRIKSTQNIEHITKAMKMVAAARLKKAQDRLESARPYARKMAEVTLDVAALTPWTFNSLLRPHRRKNKVLILVFTGDRGLAGGFHNNIVDEAIEFGEKLKSNPYCHVSYYVMGRKGFYRFHQKNVAIYKRFDRLVSGVSFGEAQKLAREITDYYIEEIYDKIYLYYAKNYSAMSHKPKAFQLLPIDPSQARKTTESGGLFIFEPSRIQLLDSILVRYVESEVYRSFLETEAGELGARMAAMSAATDSASDIIEKYQLQYNRLRQGQITKEITEIVAGAEALKKNTD
jgi:F-type H+-transporting ATPase subunit gamma